MPIRIAINGFGRIGRLVLRVAFQSPEIQIVAINDIVSSHHLAYLLKYDSVHRCFPGEVYAEEDALIVNGKKILVFSQKDPLLLPWADLSIDYVVESTGLFLDKEGASKHIQAGARRVIISAPAKEGIPTFVMGVNEEMYNPQIDDIVSNASCTTNCLAPIAKVLLDNFGIEEGLLTTIHAVTASQPIVDSHSKKDWRGGRSASQNIIPASTGAAKAVGLCLPEVKGKLTGIALRIPVVDVSTVDLTVRLTKPTSYKEICEAMRSASEGAMKGILQYCDEPLVSTDFIGNPASAIFDQEAGVALNSTFYKIIAWYDNEMGYSARIVDLIKYMASREISPKNSGTKEQQNAVQTKLSAQRM